MTIVPWYILYHNCTRLWRKMWQIWQKSEMSTSFVRNLPDLAFLWELEVSILIVFQWWRDVKVLAVDPFGGLNKLQWAFFCHSVIEWHQTMTHIRRLRTTPFNNLPQTFAIRFSVKQGSLIRSYLKGLSEGSQNNRAQTFVRQPECPRNVCARLFRDPSDRPLR